MNELSCVNIMRGDIVTTSRFDGNFFHLEILTQTLRISTGWRMGMLL